MLTIYRISSAVLLSIVLLNLWFFQSPLIGIGAFGLYTLVYIQYVRTKGYSLTGILLTLLSLTIITNSIVYYAYRTTAGTTSILLCLSFISVLAIPQKAAPIVAITKWHTYWKNVFLNLFHPFRDVKFVALFSLIGCLDTILLGILWSNRTTSLLPSPWQVVSFWFFGIFFITTMLLGYCVVHYKKRASILLIMLHIGVIYSVSALLYPLGYGFDAFIHRATETWILAHGYIVPKQPYYIGQYSLIVFLAHSTQLPVFWIDVLLVPVLSAILIPLTIAYTFAKNTALSRQHIHILAALAIPILPFLSFNLTTPHNLVLLLSLLTIFITYRYSHTKSSGWTPVLLSTAALVTHPLLGAPLFGFVLTALWIHHVQQKKWHIGVLSLSAIGQIFLLPLLFTMNNLRSGFNMPSLTNPIATLPQFFALFARPYWYLPHAPLFWEIIYTWERLIIPVTIVCALYAVLFYKKKIPIQHYLFPVTAGGIFLSAWLLRSWIVFPNVVSYEQSDYPLRMIHASLLFLLPWSILGLTHLWKIVSQKKWASLLMLICLSGVLTLSWYFLYPQRNIKARFPGFNMTDEDKEIVQWIDTESIQGTYIVLANQLVSAAALTAFSFDHTLDTDAGELYFYSIPTGGILYKYYGNMLYEGQKRSYMIDAMNTAGVDTAYFVVNTYWANADAIIAGAKQTADSWHESTNGNVIVFRYDR